MSGAFSNASVFIIDALVRFGVFLFLLRFLIQVMQVDFYNPIVQIVVNITNPILSPLRKILILPARQLFDYAALLVALLAIMLSNYLSVLSGLHPFAGLPAALFKASFELIGLVADIYFFSLLIVVVASWIAPRSSHPGLLLVYQITAPIMEPLRRLIPPLGGLDFSVLITLLILSALRRYIIPGLEQSLGSSLGLL